MVRHFRCPGRARVPRRLVFALLLAPVLLVSISCNDLPTGPADGGMALRGFNVAEWTAHGYGSAQARQALDEIASIGANSAVFIHTLYQPSVDSPAPLRGHPLTPDPAALEVAVTHARSLGLEVILKVHVDPLDGSWRGRIDPPDPARWFTTYREALGELIDFATRVGVDQFVLGTELVTTLAHEAEWRETIAFVRARFDGEICYAASWDELERVPFWRALDVIGVNFYFPVTDRKNAGRLEMLAGWQPWLGRLEALHRRVGRPVVLTEIGYMSRDGAGMQPSDYELAAPIDLDEQADLYWAALQAVSAERWIEGVCWWNWMIRAAGGPGDGGYTPRGKPALDVLREAWRPNPGSDGS